MFSADAWPADTPDWLKHVFEAEAAQHHEAGHTAVAYGYGFSVGRVFVSIECTGSNHLGPLVGYAGRFEPGKSTRPFTREVRRGYTTRAGIHAALTCGGPAAERAYRIAEGAPLRLLGASDGDHQQIEWMMRYLHAAGDRRRGLDRLAWAAAQRALLRNDVAAAVHALAEELAERSLEVDDEDIRSLKPGDVLITADITGREAMAIMRRAGLKRGALLREHSVE